VLIFIEISDEIHIYMIDYLAISSNDHSHTLIARNDFITHKLPQKSRIFPSVVRMQVRTCESATQSPKILSAPCVIIPPGTILINAYSLSYSHLDARTNEELFRLLHPILSSSLFIAQPRILDQKSQSSQPCQNICPGSNSLRQDS
jgi:hypothetical protein